MKENQELSHKHGEYQYQAIKNYGSLSMVDNGDKTGNFFDSTLKENQELCLKPGEYQKDSIENSRSLSKVDDGDKRGNLFIESEKLGLSGLEKLKRHRTEVGGRVCVPEKWGHEGSLREWMDYSSFDTILAPKGLNAAREALMSQGKRARSGSTTSSTSRMLKI